MTGTLPTRLYLLFAIAMGVVTLLFFDVIFLGRTLQPSNIYPQIHQPAEWHSKGLTRSLNPSTAAYFGYTDLGATAWQSEPARYWVARELARGESLYWNPYSAAGTLGPETAVDLKFSVFTLISAYFFHAAPESFDYGLMLIYLMGVFFILFILTRFFHLGLLAATAGGLVFLLNGFALPNLNSQNAQPYFFSPLLLCALLLYSQQQTLWRWIFLVLCHAILFTITLLPTLMLTLCVVHVLNLVYYCQVKKNPAPGDEAGIPPHKYGGFMFLSGVAAFLLTGPLWFPIIDSFFVADMISDFSSRPTQTFRNTDNLLSVFTPKHFWENYSGTVPGQVYPGIITEMDAGTIAHTGIFAALIASFALADKQSRFRPLLILCTLLLLCSYARVFGGLGFVDHVPILRSIGIQYWGCISALCLVILVAFGLENLLSAKTSAFAPLLILSLLLIFFLLLWNKLGFVELMPYRQYLKIILFLFALASLSVWLVHTSGNDNQQLAIVMLVIMVLELLFYMNQVRPQRYDPVKAQPEFVTFIKNNIGDGRVLNIGLNRTLYPEYGAMFGIREMGTQNPGRLPWYRDFFRRHFGSDTAFFLTLGNLPERNQVVLADQVLSETALDVAGVKYILVVDNAAQYSEFLHRKGYPLVFQKNYLNIFENPDYFHTATLTPALLQAETLPHTPDFHPGKTAITTDSVLMEQAQQLGIPLLASPAGRNAASAGTARVLAYHNTAILLETTSSRPAILALAEVWHPNWRATVDGQAAYIGRINEAFRGIALPAGTHRIELVYQSTARSYGLYAAGITLLILFMLGVLGFYGFPKRRG